MNGISTELENEWDFDWARKWLESVQHEEVVHGTVAVTDVVAGT